jgi:hypothetical protein
VYGFIRHDIIRVRHTKGGCIRIVMRLIYKLNQLMTGRDCWGGEGGGEGGSNKIKTAAATY